MATLGGVGGWRWRARTATITSPLAMPAACASAQAASTATRWYGHEGSILRYVFFHSIALAVLVGLLVMAQAYVPPFTELVVHG